MHTQPLFHPPAPLLPKTAPSAGYPAQTCHRRRPAHHPRHAPTLCTASAAPPPPPPPDPDIPPRAEAPSTEELLAAFEAAVGEMERDAADADEPDADARAAMSPADRRRAAREQAEADARAAHMRRLEVLSSLPADLVVQPARNTCPGCGAEMQSASADLAGFLPPERAAAKQATADGEADMPAEKPVCQRCYRLTHYGAIKPELRVSTRRPVASPAVQAPAATTGATAAGADGAPASETSGKGELSPERFKRCLAQLRGINAVVIYLIDIFDFHGSLLPSLRSLIGSRNPVILALNKIDLLPADFKPDRVESWVRGEAATLGLTQVAGLHMISSRKGTGLRVLLADAVRLAKRRRADVYVVGAANVGKSSFINQLIALRRGDASGPRAGAKQRLNRARDADRGALTTSVIPGTTLDVIKIPLGTGINLFDTPGLMVPHQITNMLDTRDLTAVVPARGVQCTTLRLGEGKTLFVGGLARVEVVSGRPFFLSCFFSADVKVHPGRSDGAHEFAMRHVGEMLTPPHSQEGFERLGEWASKSFTAEGDGWKKSFVDIVLSGLGWIALTGPGRISVRVWVPKGVGVFTRDPLMPFEIKGGVSSYTGSRTVNRRRSRRKPGRDSE